VIHGEKIEVEATQDGEEEGEDSGRRAQGQTQEHGCGEQKEKGDGPKEDSGREKIRGRNKAVGKEETVTRQDVQSRDEEEEESRRNREEARSDEGCCPQSSRAKEKEAGCRTRAASSTRRTDS
jgi:hypothetical protein